MPERHTKEERAVEAEADRIMQLLDGGLAALRKGDADGTVLFLEEAIQSVDRLPKNPGVICLPDRSKERLPGT